jgi:hypothetical protein
MGKPQPQRLEPPTDMPPAQAEIWNQIVASMPAGFFNQENEFALRALVAGASADQGRQAMTIYVSFVLRPKRFVAHREGLPEISAPSLPELRALLAEAHGGAAVRLHLSRRARAEVARPLDRPAARRVRHQSSRGGQRSGRPRSWAHHVGRSFHKVETPCA